MHVADNEKSPGASANHPQLCLSGKNSRHEGTQQAAVRQGACDRVPLFSYRVTNNLGRAFRISATYS